MKKIIKIGFVFAFILFVSGCNKKAVTCTIENDQSASGYVIKTTYNIYSNKDIVTKVETNEVITSKNNTILAYFEKNNKDKYDSENKKYGGYTVNVLNKDGKVTTNITIDYNKMDVDKFVTDNTAMKSYVNDKHQVTLKGAKTLYESLGATCK